MSASRQVLYVHGRDCKPAANVLGELVVDALTRGIRRDYPDCVELFKSARRHNAYYGDLNNELLKSLGRHYDEALDVSDRRHALMTLKAIEGRKQFGIRQYDCLPGKSAFAEFLTTVATPFIGATGLWMWWCRRRSADFAAYLKNQPGYADDVRARVREKLVAALSEDAPLMLISHGTGSAVAWDVLWELSHGDDESLRQRKVDTWLTLGTPLGDRHVRKRLKGNGEKGTRRFPTNVLRWHNVSAEDDYTCHDNTVADDFAAMLQQRLTSSIHDYKIYNHAVRYGRSNPHSSVGYLVHPRTTKIVVDWLQAGA